MNSTTFYHGTKAKLQHVDLIAPSYNSNFGSRKTASYVYFTATMDAAIWGAELRRVMGPERRIVKSGRLTKMKTTNQRQFH